MLAIRKHNFRRKEELSSDWNSNEIVKSFLSFAFHITKGSEKHYMKLRSGSERRIYSPCAHHPRSPHNIGIASPAPSYQGWRVSGYRPGDTFLITICLSLRSVLPLSCQLNLFVATRQEEGKSRALLGHFCPVLSDRHPGIDCDQDRRLTQSCNHSCQL